MYLDGQVDSRGEIGDDVVDSVVAASSRRLVYGLIEVQISERLETTTAELILSEV